MTLSQAIQSLRELLRRVEALERRPANAPVRQPAAPPRRAGFWASVYTVSQDGTNKRWAYAVREVEKTSTGYGGWTLVTGGREVWARNTFEDVNSSSGLFGNGVNSANLVGTMTLQRVPDDVIVWVWEVPVTGQVDPEYWFSYANGIDGACSA